MKKTRKARMQKMQHQTIKINYKKFQQFFIVSLLLNFNQFVSGKNLYTEFNEKLDKVSNYAKNKMQEETSKSLDKILEDNSKFIKMNIDKTQRGRNLMENLNEKTYSLNPNLRQFFHVISPYYNNPSVQDKEAKEDEFDDEINSSFDWAMKNPIKFKRFLENKNKFKRQTNPLNYPNIMATTHYNDLVNKNNNNNNQNMMSFNPLINQQGQQQFPTGLLGMYGNSMINDQTNAVTHLNKTSNG